MDGFGFSLFMVFIAEMGDKTQLVALCLASRFNAKVVLAGILTATLAVHIISVLIGGSVGKFLPEAWIKIAAGLAFIGFGLWTLNGDTLSEDECSNLKGKSPFWLVTTTFFLAELGDKTMLSTVSLATNPAYNLVAVWIGSSMGMVLSDGLAILVGQLLGKNLPEKGIKIGAAVIFFAFGILSLIAGAMKLPFYGWLIAAICSLLMVALFLNVQRKENMQKKLFAHL